MLTVTTDSLCQPEPWLQSSVQHRTFPAKASLTAILTSLPNSQGNLVKAKCSLSLGAVHFLHF